MKKYIIAGMFVVALVPSVSYASTLSPWQISALIGLLQAFNVDAVTIARVQTNLAGEVTTSDVTLTNGTITATSTSGVNNIIIPITVNTPPVNTGTAPVDVTPPVVVDKSGLAVKLHRCLPENPVNLTRYGYGECAWDVQLLDKKGNNVMGATITMTTPDLVQNLTTTADSTQGATFGYGLRGMKEDITFSSNGFSKTVTVGE